MQQDIYVPIRMFSNYKYMDDGQLNMENLSTSKVLDVRNVMLDMNFKKLLNLNNVLHVVGNRKNLVYDSLLSKNSFNIVFYYDKFVLIKIRMFVRNVYLYDDLFKMSITTIVTKNEMNNNNNNNTFSSYFFESYDM